jgi:hypothetical protein
VALNDDLEALTAATTGRQIPEFRVPAGWSPSVAYGADGRAEVVTIGEGVPGPDDWTDEVRALGVAVPDGWRCRLVKVSHDPAAWIRLGQGDDATTIPVTRRVWAVEPARPVVDVDELVAAIGRRRPKPVTQARTDQAAVLCLSDWQVGKETAAGGSDVIVGRVVDALDRFASLVRKRRPSTIVLAVLGDMCEGQASQNGGVALFSDLTVTEQVRIVRRLLLEHVTRLAPLCDRLVVPVAPGNHDETTRLMGMKPRATDSWLVDVAAAVHDALQLAGGFDHVEIVTPDPDDLTVTVEACGTIIGATHGHVFRKGKGHDWWARQAHARHRIAAADILLTGHYHHLRIEQDGDRLWMQAPTVDTGSPWFDQRHGGQSTPGTLTFWTSAGTVTDINIL